MGLRIWHIAHGVTETLKALMNYCVVLVPHLVSLKSLLAPVSLKSLGALERCSNPNQCQLRHW